MKDSAKDLKCQSFFLSVVEVVRLKFSVNSDVPKFQFVRKKKKKKKKKKLLNEWFF